MKVRDLMTTELFTLREDHRLDLASDIMNWQRIRHIPIVDEENHLKGLLTHRDLLSASVSRLAQISENDQRELHRQIRVGDIMQSKVITTSPNSDLREVAATMIDEKVGCMPVVENNKLVGMITEADFLTLAWEVMTKRVSEKDYKDVRKYCHTPQQKHA